VKPFASGTGPSVAVATATVLAPGVPGGVRPVRSCVDWTWMSVRGLPSIVAVVAPIPVRKPVPAIETSVPPVVGPSPGITSAMVRGARYVKAPARVAVPPGVVTTRSAGPAAAPGGVVPVIVMASSTMSAPSGRPPSVTVVSPSMKPVPAIVTLSSPASAPSAGAIGLAASVGASRYVNETGVESVPPGVVTTTSTAPAEGREGSVAAIVVSPWTVKAVGASGEPSTRTCVSLEANAVPVIVTARPASGPFAGAIVVASGTAR